MLIAIIVLAWLLSGTIFAAIVFGVMWCKTDKKLQQLEEQLQDILIESREFNLGE